MSEIVVAAAPLVCLLLVKAPLYVCGAAVSTVEDLALWDPSLFGGPNAPTPHSTWQRLPKDNWWSAGTQAWAGSTDGWPITSMSPAKGGQPPPIHPQIVGAEMCSWSNPQALDEGLLFAANCTQKHPKGSGGHDSGRPAPRVATCQEDVEKVPNRRREVAEKPTGARAL